MIYLIGPSGVGKSSCGKYAEEKLASVSFCSLDALCKGHEFDWPVCNRALDDLISQERHGITSIIVDIGAGTQTLPQFFSYLAAHAEDTLLIFAPPEEVVLRNPLGPHRRMDEFRYREYTTREQLYRMARKRVDVGGMNRTMAQETFLNVLLTSFPHLSRHDPSDTRV